MKKFLFLLILFPVISNAQLKNILKQSSETATGLLNKKGTVDIAAGLKEALNKGITEQVSKLTQVDGFYKNELVKIVMPEELTKVDKTLRKLGMGSLADDGIKALNRAAEDAVKEATPVFVAAIKNIKIADAKTILMGNENAATTYLQQSTNKELYAKFLPVVQQSIGKVGADKIWNGIVQKYNTVPLVSKVNPDLNDYVTNKTLEGVFKMIAVEEKNIRTNLKSRTSPLLIKVFSLQD
ncbi:Protein of unknown function [Flavobacterium succinicans]|jgi:hypothetical protein|uniref:DUF4197 domain-containing protein n=1 Tax=Flavobacterium succinicans TaxID=29536 RepID=A0A1I4TH14_9FLAO|nr:MULTISPECIES: DUF4197 domain-containing protein [Flavobacterium]OOV27610.1 hypothetical protein BXU11_09095 [Flavobacterium sp. LM5]SFM75982.1 Protein of unknown function [Flavobacterium succinicans]